MNSTLSKVLKFFLAGLLLVAVLLSIVYFKAVAGLHPDATFEQQDVQLGSLLDSYMFYAYILAGAAAVLTIAFAIVKMVLDPKSAVKSIASIIILGVIVFIGWSIAEDKVLEIPGYKGEDNVPETLKMSGMILWTTWITAGLSILTALYAEISRAFK